MTIEDVIDTYGDMVTRICIMNLRNSDDAKDCFQEVFIKLYNHGMIEDHDYLCLLYTSPSPRDTR